MNSTTFARFVLTFGFGAMIGACAFNPHHAQEAREEESLDNQSHRPVVLSQPEKSQYPQATATDQYIDAKPHILPDVKQPTTPGVAVKETSAPTSTTGGAWRIQVGTLPDLESAQARKRELDAKLTSPVDMTFDAPYYKLRWGGFATKQEAEDKLLEMSEIFREAFVIRP